MINTEIVLWAPPLRFWHGATRGLNPALQFTRMSWLTNKACLSTITVTNIYQSFTYTRWRQKPTGIDMKRNYVTVTLCIPHSNWSLMACFVDIDVSQGSAATYARCGGIFNIRLTANLPKNLSVKKCKLKRFFRIVAMSLSPHLFGPPFKNNV